MRRLAFGLFALLVSSTLVAQAQDDAEREATEQTDTDATDDADDIARPEVTELTPEVAEAAEPTDEPDGLPAPLFGDAPPEAVEEEAPTIAHVEERDVVSSSPRTMLGRRASVWLELGGTSGGAADARVAGFSSEIGMRYRVADAVVVEASFGLTFASTNVQGEVVLGGMPTPYAASIDRLEPGNPTLGGAYVLRTDAVLFEVGLALSIPTAARDDPGRDAETAAQRASSEVALRAPMAMRGYRGAFRWAPERLGLAVPFRVVVPIAPVVLEIDGALALLTPVLGDRGVDVDTLVELGVGVGATVIGPLSLGARIGGVGAASGVLVPGFTFSVEPWLGLRFDPVRLTARGVLNLSGDDGVGASRGPSFGIFVASGVEL